MILPKCKLTLHLTIISLKSRNTFSIEANGIKLKIIIISLSYAIAFTHDHRIPTANLPNLHVRYEPLLPQPA